MPRIGRILMARGRDATDVAIVTSFGPCTLVGFKVITDEVADAGGLGCGIKNAGAKAGIFRNHVAETYRLRKFGRRDCGDGEGASPLWRKLMRPRCKS